MAGRCWIGGSRAFLERHIPGVTMADGEVRVEVKAVQAAERVRVVLRQLPSAPYDAHHVAFTPSIGEVRLVSRFVELHGGRIRVTSAVGVGSTFAFRLPQPMA